MIGIHYPVKQVYAQLVADGAGGGIVPEVAVLVRVFLEVEQLALGPARVGGEAVPLRHEGAEAEPEVIFVVFDEGGCS